MKTKINKMHQMFVKRTFEVLASRIEQEDKDQGEVSVCSDPTRRPPPAT